MSIEENKAIVREYHERMNRRDFSVIDELLSEDFIIHRSDGLTGDRDIFKQANIDDAFPDSVRTIEDIIAEGDRVALRESIRGTHSRKFRNVEATGKIVNTSRYIFFRVSGNKIAEMWYLSDYLNIYQQIGALPPTEKIGG